MKFLILLSLVTVFVAREVTGSLECTICEDVMKYAESELINLKSEQEVENYLDGICKNHVFPALYPYCKELVAVMVPKIWQYIQSGQSFSPQSLCADVGFCSSSMEAMVHPRNIKQIASSSGFCLVCEEAMKVIDQELASPVIQSKVKDAIDAACQRLPNKDYQTTCKTLIGEYWDQIWQMFTEQLQADKVCKEIHLCNSNSKVPAKFLAKHNVGCEICHDALQFVNNAIFTPAHEQALLGQIEGLCKKIPNEQYAQICDQLVEEYGDQIFQEIVQIFNPTSFCQMVKACPASSMEAMVHSKNIKQIASNDEMCLLCEEGMKFVDQELASPDIQSEVKDKLHAVCKKLPNEDYQTICITLIDEYWDQLWQMLTEQLQADKVCKEIHLCNSNSKVPAKFLAKHNVGCEICHDALQFVNNAIFTPAHEQALLGQIEGLCKKIPNEQYAQICDQLVEEYGDQIFQQIVQIFNPTSFCQMVKACPASSMRQEASGINMCQICKNEVKMLDDQLSNTAVESTVQKALLKVCDSIPNQDYQEICQTLINQYFDQIWQMILQEISPDNVCDGIHLCTSHGAPAFVATGDSIGCTICHQAMQWIINNVLNQKNEQQFLNMASGVCKNIPNQQDAQMCIQLIDKYGDQIFKELNQAITANGVCQAVKACPSSSMKVEESSGNNIGCQVCEQAMTWLDKNIFNAQNEENLLSAMAGICQNIPNQEYAQMCAKLVQQYGKEILQQINGLMQPDNICKMVHACPSSFMVKGSNIGCQICHQAITYLDQNLFNAKNEQVLLNQLAGICQNIPNQQYAQMCAQLVDKYGKEILQNVNNMLQPDNVCKMVHACPSSSFNAVQESSGGCSICEDAINFLAQEMSSQDVENMVQKELGQICNKLPAGQYQDICNTLVSSYFDQIWQAVLGELSNSQEICQMLHLCGSKAMSELKAAGDNPGCSICKMMMNYIDKNILTPQNEQAILSQLAGICQNIPNQQYAQECSQLVEKYGDIIIQQIQSALKPDNICQTLKACPAPSFNAVQQSSGGCTICEDAINFLAQEMSSQDVENMAQKELQQICNKLPAGQYQDACNQIISSYFDQIWQAVVQELGNSQEICQMLHLCGSKAFEQLKSGGDNPECSICKMMMTYVDKYILTPQNEQTILQQLAGICQNIPNQQYAQECSQLVEKYGDIIIQQIQSALKPDNICQTLKACPAPAMTAVKSDTCELCETAIDFLDQELQSQDIQKMVHQELDVVCGKIPSQQYADVCKSLVDQYFDQLWQMVVQELSNAQQVCHMFHLCDPNAIKMLKSAGNNMGCSVCEQVMTYADKNIFNIQNEMKAVSLLYGLCDNIPNQQFAQECQQLITKYGREIIQNLNNLLQPNTFCQMIKVCPASFEVKFDGCKLCESGINILDKLLQSKWIEGLAKKEALKACSAIKKQEEQAICNDVVNMYFDQIWSMIAQALSDSSKICGNLRLCKNNIFLRKNQMTCDFCEQIMKYVDAQVLNSKTENMVLSKVEALCAKIPNANMAGECKVLVEQYGKMFFQQVQNFMQPSNVCHVMKFC